MVAPYYGLFLGSEGGLGSRCGGVSCRSVAAGSRPSWPRILARSYENMGWGLCFAVRS